MVNSKTINKEFKNKGKKYNVKNIIISCSDEKGEGEHKIFTHLNSNLTTDNIIINGLDADLIILSLISGINNIYLMRENNNSNNSNNNKNNSNIIYVSIDTLKQALLDELRPKWVNLDTNEIIESYCVMCSILGNDFIPHILNLNIKSGGLDKLISVTELSIKNNGSLVENNKINQATLTEIAAHNLPFKVEF